MFGGKTHKALFVAAIFLGSFFVEVSDASAVDWKPRQFRDGLVVRSLNVRDSIKNKKGRVKIKDDFTVTGESLLKRTATFQKLARFLRNIRVDGNATFNGEVTFNDDVHFPEGFDGAHLVLNEEDVEELNTNAMEAGTLFFDSESSELRLWDGDAWFDFAAQEDAGSEYTAGDGLSLNGSTFSSDLGDSIESGELADGAVTSAKITDGTIALDDLSDNSCGNNEILKYNGSEWTCATDATGGTAALDDAYNNGQSITVDEADVAFNLNDDTNDYQLVIDNTTAGAIDSAVSVLTSGGGSFTTALDLSASNIGTAINIGDNDIETSSATISAAELNRLDGKDAALVDTNDTPSWTAAHAWSLSGTENVSLGSDLDGAVDVLSLTGTPSGTDATARGIAVQQADSANSNGFDSILFIDNADTNLAVTDAITITDSGGGGFTNLLSSPTVDISGAGVISGATGFTSSGTITLSNLTSCTALETNGSGVVSCGDDDDTTYTAGDGLTLSSGEFSVDLGTAIDTTEITDGTITFADLSNNGCAGDQVMKYNGAAWVCADQTDTTYTAGTGLSLADTTFSAELGTAIDTSEITNGTILFEDVASNSCGSGEVMKYDGADWTCGNDNTVGSTLTGSSAIDAAEIPEGECSDIGTISVAGAAVGEPVVAVPTPTTNGVEDEALNWTAYVSAVDTVSIRVCNVDMNALDAENPDSQTWSVIVFQ